MYSGLAQSAIPAAAEKPRQPEWRPGHVALPQPPTEHAAGTGQVPAGMSGGMSLSLVVKRRVPAAYPGDEGWLERLRRHAGRGDVLGVLRVMAGEWDRAGPTLQCCDVVRVTPPPPCAGASIRVNPCRSASTCARSPCAGPASTPPAPGPGRHTRRACRCLCEVNVYRCSSTATCRVQVSFFRCSSPAALPRLDA
jgi:hypothetical protein